jgi:hypothetical protein
MGVWVGFGGVNIDVIDSSQKWAGAVGACSGSGCGPRTAGWEGYYPLQQQWGLCVWGGWGGGGQGVTTAPQATCLRAIDSVHVSSLRLH